MRIARYAALTAALAALALGTAVTGTPGALAGTPTFTITVTPDHARPTDSVTVSGSNACASSPYTVTMSYTNPDGDTATATEDGTTSSDGTFEQPFTVPENAVAGEPASFQASVDCSSGTPAPSESVAPSSETAAPSQSGFALAAATGTQSNVVAFTVDAWQGTLTTDTVSGQPGDTVHVSGTLCYGGDIIVTFTDGDNEEEVDVTLNSDHTYAGDYTLPDAPPGEYAFTATCPGSDFDDRAFVLGASVVAAPPAAPEPGVVTTTG
jgi:5-hydroxyisourate hydrolase-like protein (transthyretin family)